MKDNPRNIRVRFVDQKLFDAFKKLQSGRSEEKRLVENLENAIVDLKRDPFRGVRIPKQLWPKVYVQRYDIRNLWKYNLPDAWRLIYTVVGNEVEIISVLLEWFNHKDYEKRFKYRVR